MEECLEIKYEAGEMFAYQKGILEKHACSLFLPANFIAVENAEGERMYSGLFDTTGCVSLRHYRPTDVCEALDIVLSLLDRMIAAEDLLIFIGDYMLQPELMFISKGMDGAESSLAWTGIPSTMRNYYFAMDVLHDGICSILDMLSKNLGGDGVGYLKHAWEITAGAGFQAGALKRRLFRIRTEAQLCGYSRSASSLRQSSFERPSEMLNESSKAYLNGDA